MRWKMSSKTGQIRFQQNTWKHYTHCSANQRLRLKKRDSASKKRNVSLRTTLTSTDTPKSLQIKAKWVLTGVSVAYGVAISVIIATIFLDIGRMPFFIAHIFKILYVWLCWNITRKHLIRLEPLLTTNYFDNAELMLTCSHSSTRPSTSCALNSQLLKSGVSTFLFFPQLPEHNLRTICQWRNFSQLSIEVPFSV